MNRHWLSRAARNAEMESLHLTFFVAAIATELCIRTELYLTNYPQLGGHGLHIAHLLWGGVFMVAALAILLSLLGRRARQVAALLAGVGFGFFIDELGKFITADNNYFYKPAAGLIYLVFIALYFGSRAFQRHRGLTEAERVRNAVELIGEATAGPFREEYRDRALALLAAVPASNPLRAPLVELAGRLDTDSRPGAALVPASGRAERRRLRGLDRTRLVPPRGDRRLRLLGAGLAAGDPRPGAALRLLGRGRARRLRKRRDRPAQLRQLGQPRLLRRLHPYSSSSPSCGWPSTTGSAPTSGSPGRCWSRSSSPASSPSSSPSSAPSSASPSTSGC